MVEVISEIVPNLKGCKAFGFEAKNNIKQEEKISYYSEENSFSQKRKIGEIRAVINQISSIPCEITLETGAKDGRCFMDGRVHPYDKRSRNRIVLVLGEFCYLADNFAHLFPKSSFSLKITQSITITDVYRK